MHTRFAATERPYTLIGLNEIIVKIRPEDTSNRLNIIISMQSLAKQR